MDLRSYADQPYLDPFDGELWECFEPQDAKYALVMVNTEHLTDSDASCECQTTNPRASHRHNEQSLSIEFTGEDALAS